MSYQTITGTLNPGAHPGSYNGQDAYNDLLVTDNESCLHGKRPALSDNDGRNIQHAGLYARSASDPYWGGEDMDENYETVAGTLDSNYYKGCGERQGVEREVVCMSDRKGHNGVTTDGTATTLTAQEKERPMVSTSIVRRLTPKECERLQGYSDDYTKLDPIEEMPDADYEFWKGVLFDEAVRNGTARQNETGVWEIWRVKRIADDDDSPVNDEWENTHKPYAHKTKAQMVKWYNKSFCNDTDSPRYKALGNSIAVGYAKGQSGFWCWLARKICAQYERQITMASLFDGIGGFPLAFSAAGAVPVWASEIEEFCIAVTKRHFPEEGTI